MTEFNLGWWGFYWQQEHISVFQMQVRFCSEYIKRMQHFNFTSDGTWCLLEANSGRVTLFDGFILHPDRKHPHSDIKSTKTCSKSQLMIKKLKTMKTKQLFKKIK